MANCEYRFKQDISGGTSFCEILFRLDDVDFACPYPERDSKECLRALREKLKNSFESPDKNKLASPT